MAIGLFVAGIAWDVVEDIRGTVAMTMFILEEAAQTAMMGEWVALKEELYKDAIDLNMWISYYLASQGLELSESPYANAAYPMNKAYIMFFSAIYKTLEIYTEVVRKHLSEIPKE